MSTLYERAGVVVYVTMRDGDTGDERIDLRSRLIAFRYTDVSKGADGCTLELENEDLSVLDDGRLRRGNEIEVSWGYDGIVSRPRRMVIKKITGGRSIRIEAHHKVVKLHKVQRVRAFERMTRSEIAKQLLQEHGETTEFVVDTTERIDLLNQLGETDAVFLQRMAAKEGFKFWGAPDGMHWGGEPYSATPRRVLIYRKDLASGGYVNARAHLQASRGDIVGFNVNSDLSMLPGRVDVTTVDPSTRKVLTESGSDEKTPRKAVARMIEVVDPESGVTKLVTQRMATSTQRQSGSGSAAAAKKEADARYQDAARKGFEMTVDIVGDPEVEATEVVEVLEMGQYLSGKWFVHKGEHEARNGYMLKLTLRRENAEGNVAGQESKADVNTARPKPREEVHEDVDGESGEITYRREAVGG